MSSASLRLKMKDKFLEKFSFLSNFINKGHDRSVRAKKNILASFLIKCLSIGIGLLLVRLTIDYINPSRYGIWLTLSSIVAWFSFFDIGLTQGLRNKFAAAIANGQDSLAQIYVSTTYAILAIIFSIIWILFLIVNQFLDWSKILNISESMRSEVSILAVIVFTYFCLQFVFRIITTIITADQQPAKASLIDVFGPNLILIFCINFGENYSRIPGEIRNCFMCFPAFGFIRQPIFFSLREYSKNTDRYSQRLNFHTPKGFLISGLFFLLYRWPVSFNMKPPILLLQEVLAPQR